METGEAVPWMDKASSSDRPETATKGSGERTGLTRPVDFTRRSIATEHLGDFQIDQMRRM